MDAADEVEHPDAPSGKALKYARIERERRFLLSRLPPGAPVRRAEITDRYLQGTRLRLREVVETTTTGTTTVRKLTQKVFPAGGTPGLVTTMYVDEAEFARLRALPGTDMTKIRYSFPPLGIDVFTGVLEGLVLAEAEFASDEEAGTLPPPPEAVADVSADPRFTGGRLAGASRDHLLSVLAEHGVGPLDASGLAQRGLRREGPDRRAR